MARTTRIIPAVDVMGGMVVRLYRGDPNKKTIYGDDPVATALKWQKHGADMLHVVDLDAALGSGSNHDTVQRIVDAVSIPVQVAGGLRSVQSAIDAASTAERIVLGTLAFTDVKSLSHIVDEVGAERVVVSADHKNGSIVIRGWQDTTGVTVRDALAELSREAGITEFLITSVGTDGTLQGPDVSYLREACSISDRLNIIASGGISGAGDVSLVSDAGAWGVILGRALYDQKMTIPDAKKSLLPSAPSSRQSDAQLRRSRCRSRQLQKTQVDNVKKG